MDMLVSAHELTDRLVALRRRLHRDPEIGLDLPGTQAAVLDALAGLPLEVTCGRRSSSVTAVLRGRDARSSGSSRGPSRRRTVLLRADMDALPVVETTGLPFASTRPGAMHACGHDLHTAMLVGAAHLLAARRDELDGDVVLMFQPGEEGYEGARTMIEEGVLDAAGSRVDAAYALHVFSALATGVHTRPGTITAASAALRVTVRGRGGHASAPHRAADPVPATAEMITALQTLVTRRIDVFDPAVITVGTLRAGTRGNVIPDTAEFEATVRSFSSATAESIRTCVTTLIGGIAAAHGLEADVRVEPQRPATVNDPAEAGFAAGIAADLLGPSRYAALEHPLAGSEDFSRVLAEVPGAFVALGATPAGTDPGTAPDNHSGAADFDESTVPEGAALYAELARRRVRTTADQHGAVIR
jgi:amidohydrolase